MVLILPLVAAFSPQIQSSQRTSIALNAIGALAKKAKENSLRQYAEGGVEDNVMDAYKAMKAAMEGNIDLDNQTVGPIQESLTRRKGTLTVVAEYKRKTSFGDVHETHVPELLSPIFREFGAAAIAVMADERMGGCDYKDIASFVEEQRRARNEVPGSVPVLNNDLIIDELQVARSKAYGCGGLVLNLGITGAEQTTLLLKAAKAAQLEAVVAVTSREEAQTAINLGARMINVINVDKVDDIVAVIEGLDIPEGQTVTKIANIPLREDQSLQEIEDAWAIRDRGFNVAWVGEPLYKGRSDPNEQPGGIIKSMKSKSSLRFASPKASSGRGEGAREYLGDIMM